jgi:hypothetical protein
VGWSAPWLAHATMRIAASVCGSAVCPTACMADGRGLRLSNRVFSKAGRHDNLGSFYRICASQIGA